MKFFVLSEIVSDGRIKSEDIRHPFDFPVFECELIELYCLDHSDFIEFVEPLHDPKNVDEH
jgi:hypothetical protein